MKQYETQKVAKRHKKKIKSKNSIIDAYIKPIIFLIAMIMILGISSIFIIKAKNRLLPEINGHVKKYEDLISLYAKQYDMEEYIPLVMAVMMQESKGKGSDVMQCSACMYNKRYPDGITDPEYSIEVGILYLKHCLETAGCQDALDMDRISLALQGYNYGSGFIKWAIEQDGGYTKENARQFSEDMKNAHQSTVYGDPLYVQHVLQYYDVD